MPHTLNAVPSDKEPQEMKTEKQDKFAAVDKDIAGLQQAIRNQVEQTNQALSLLGQMRQEFEMERSNVKRLQLEMEKVYTYLNENRR
jgi:hypothetical protein